LAPEKGTSLRKVMTEDVAVAMHPEEWRNMVIDTLSKLGKNHSKVNG